MAMTLSQDDLDAILQVVLIALAPNHGGIDPEDVPVESFEEQTITHTLLDGSARVDHTFVEEE